MRMTELKKLIRESVEEVIREEIQVLREELADLFKSQLLVKPQRPTLRELVENPIESRQVRSSLKEAYLSKIGGGEDPYAIRPMNPIAAAVESPLAGNPYADMLADTAENLTAQDIKGIRTLNT